MTEQKLNSETKSTHSSTLNKNPIIWVVVLFLLAIIVIVLYKYKSTKLYIPNEKVPVSLLENYQVSTSQVSLDKLPENFPEDIPLETGAKITQSFNATTTSGIFQATRKFEISNSIDKSFNFYKDIFSKNDWSIVSVTNKTQLKTILASKKKMQAQVVVSENPVSKVKTVEISVTQIP